MRAIYPGSFDPPTLGHVGIARRSAQIFGEVRVGIGANPSKGARYSVDVRRRLLEVALGGDRNTSVVTFSGLLTSYCVDNEIDVIVRGLRNRTEMGHEMAMAQMNRRLAGVDTFFIPASPRVAHVSSTLAMDVHQDANAANTFFARPVLDELRRITEGY
jgi:pantetheine-phosphate adenylyltransferase